MSESQDPADLIHIVSRQTGSAQVRLGHCQTVVTLKVSTDDQGEVRLAQSHWIRTPDDITRRARRPHGFAGTDPKHALGAAISELAQQFSRGLKLGHAPDESWFVPIPLLASV